MRRVLIVDDDPKVCETLDRYLSHAGYGPPSASADRNTSGDAPMVNSAAPT